MVFAFLGVLKTKSIMLNLQAEPTETNEICQPKIIMYLTNGTNIPNPQAERAETNEIHQQNNMMEFTNATNLPYHNQLSSYT